MRIAMLSRSGLGKRHVRLDPAFYLGQDLLQSTTGAESNRHVRLEDIVESVHDGARLPSVASGLPMLRLKNVRPCELDLTGMTQVDGSAAKWVNVQKHDVVFTRAAQPFRAAAVQSGVPSELAISSELTIFRPHPAVLPEYLAAVFCTPTLNQILCDLAYRGGPSALPRLRLSDIARLPIPLPPRSLQESIGRRYQQAVDLTARARSEIDTVVSAIHTEIGYRVAGVELPQGSFELSRASLPNRWDFPFNRGRAFRQSLASHPTMLPLLHLATPGNTSVRGLSDDEEVCVVQASDVDDESFLIEGGEHRSLSQLSSRMRQRLAVGDVLLCTTGSGEQIAFVDEELGRSGRPIVGSATFTTLRFHETPRVFAVSLAHPLVREQLRQLSSGSVQRFVHKRDLDELLVPVLGHVWREDFETRLSRAMQRRREALQARSALIAMADNFVREILP